MLNKPFLDEWMANCKIMEYGDTIYLLNIKIKLFLSSVLFKNENESSENVSSSNVISVLHNF